MASITHNLHQVRHQIREACERAGRPVDSVRLLAVSKTKPVSCIQEAVAADQWLFGENRVQEARLKIPQLALPKAAFHFVGPLQRNKVKEAVALFQMIESLDSLELAEEIQRRSPKAMPVLVQVNVGREPQKRGFLPEQLREALLVLAEMDKLQIKGLMTMHPLTDNGENSRPLFRHLADLAQEMKLLAIPGVEMEELSMGMSRDFTIAIQEGATLVRVASAIFGPPVQKNFLP
ncbi:MAG: YggS family pyridoxal phosphate-dependent enzyme [Magnetococcales bacterium]|nr:YggS family pyridoxal phosphate-dependent enzyme [Magnetococcales bacterium]